MTQPYEPGIIKLLNKLPGSGNTKAMYVAVGICTIACSLKAAMPSKPKGHGYFDSDKPQAVKNAMREAEEKRR